MAGTDVAQPELPSAVTTAPIPDGRRELALVTLGALGIVYGDIGTSPLYAIKECLAWHPTGAYSPHAVIPILPNVLGVLSLVLWALVLVVSVKYLWFVLRADNHGEGGILALGALAGPRIRDRGRAKRLSLSILLALVGTGLLFGDGVITPAISVLGAIEGISAHRPALHELVVPITVVILIALFLAQRLGTRRIGFAFGPVMLVWFIAIGATGIRWIFEQPIVLHAINPIHGIRFLMSQGMTGFVLLGFVFLVITGSEALYADVGHFGKRPIRIAWFAIALPGLLLNYFGQGALLLVHEPGTIRNPFYAMVDGPLLIPMLVLATTAAIIASQALISGVFSMTRQAMQLGFWPRVTIVHTSAMAEGQIYIREVNWILMIACIAVVVEFRTSSGLAAAYGIAVTGAMAITTVLFYLVCRQRWRVSRVRALAFLVPFLAIDVVFFAANTLKVPSGGWLPIVIAVIVLVVMTTWWRGRLELTRALDETAMPERMFLEDLDAGRVFRVRGTGVFLSPTPAGIPNVLLHHIKHNKSLHECVVLMSIRFERVPWIHVERALRVQALGHGFFRVVASFGFMQQPDVPSVLARCTTHGVDAEPATTTYYLARETLLTGGKAPFARWRKRVFSFLARNARSATSLFGLPPNRVVELGTVVEI